MIFLRDGDKDDAIWMAPQLKQFSDMYDTVIQIYSGPDYAEEFMRNMIANQVVLVAEDDEIGEVGFICGSLVKHYMNPEITVLAETFWWVKEGNRSSRAGSMLLREFIKQGNKLARWVSLSLLSQSPVKPGSLIKRGFKAKEQVYLMEF